MAGKFSRKKEPGGASWPLGLTLILLLLAALFFGGRWVLHAAKDVGTSDAPASQETHMEEASLPQDAPSQDVSEPTPSEPAAEEDPAGTETDGGIEPGPAETGTGWSQANIYGQT